MPVIRVRKKRASLSRLLRGPYVSREDERTAMEAWARSQSNLWHAEALSRFARIGLPEIPLWFNGFFGALLAGGLLVNIFAYSVRDFPLTVFLIMAGALGLSQSLPNLVRYCAKPQARRAALWLAWLGNKNALPYLLRALRLRPVTQKQQRWIIEVETALTELLDLLPAGTELEASRAKLENLLRQSYRARRVLPTDDFTPSRAYLLAAIVRYLYRDHLLGDGPQLLRRILTTPADPALTPNRALVREVAAMYYPYPVQQAPVTAPHKIGTTVPLVEAVAQLRRRS